MMGFIPIGGFQLMKMNNLYELRILEIDEIVLSPSQILYFSIQLGFTC